MFSSLSFKYYVRFELLVLSHIIYLVTKLTMANDAYSIMLVSISLTNLSSQFYKDSFSLISFES